MSVVEVVDNFLNIEFNSNYFQLIQLLHRKIISARERGYNSARKTYLERALFCLREPEQILNLSSEFLWRNLWNGDDCDQIVAIFSVVELIDNFSRENLSEIRYIFFVKEFQKIICRFLLERYPILDEKYQWLQILITRSVRFENLV